MIKAKAKKSDGYKIETFESQAITLQDWNCISKISRATYQLARLIN